MNGYEADNLVRVRFRRNWQRWAHGQELELPRESGLLDALRRAHGVIEEIKTRPTPRRRPPDDTPGRAVR